MSASHHSGHDSVQSGCALPRSSPLGRGLRRRRRGFRLILAGLDLAALPLDLLLDDELVLVESLLDLAVRHLPVLHLQFQLYAAQGRLK